MTDFFNFEDKEIDIPFYNGIPELSRLKWGLLILGLILFLVLLYIPIPIQETVLAILFCLVLLLPTLYVLGSKWNLMFRKIRRKDILPIIVLFILEFIYAMLILYILESLGLTAATPASQFNTSTTLISFINMAIQLMGEELFKIILLIVLMFVFYHFLNRKQSLIISMILTCIVFGLLHAGYYGGILQVVLIQGLGSIFEVYLYVKTKNVMVSYTCHLIYDCVPIFFEIIALIMAL